MNKKQHVQGPKYYEKITSTNKTCTVW